MNTLPFKLSLYALFLFTAFPAAAYIGPGAGIVLAGPMLMLLAAIGVAVCMLGFLPYRLYRQRTRKKKQQQQSEKTPADNG